MLQHMHLIFILFIKVTTWCQTDWSGRIHDLEVVASSWPLFAWSDDDLLMTVDIVCQTCCCLQAIAVMPTCMQDKQCHEAHKCIDRLKLQHELCLQQCTMHTTHTVHTTIQCTQHIQCTHHMPDMCLQQLEHSMHTMHA